MKKSNLGKVTSIGLLVTILLLVLGIVAGVAQPEQKPAGAIALKAPAFINVAHADETAITSFADDEAGIAAYFDAEMSIDLDDVDHLFRTIESQTNDHILGSLPLTDYNESHDVHLYISTDGWVMVYYRKSEPTSRIFDWNHYSGESTLPTKLELGLDIVATEIGALVTPNYYHFNYPNATDLMLIAEFITVIGTDSFDVSIPSEFSYYERSWSFLSPGWANFFLGDIEIASSYTNGAGFYEDTLSAAQLAPDTVHTFTINQWNNAPDVFGGLALVYRVP